MLAAGLTEEGGEGERDGRLRCKEEGRKGDIEKERTIYHQGNFRYRPALGARVEWLTYFSTTSLRPGSISWPSRLVTASSAPFASTIWGHTQTRH